MISKISYKISRRAYKIWKHLLIPCALVFFLGSPTVLKMGCYVLLLLFLSSLQVLQPYSTMGCYVLTPTLLVFFWVLQPYLTMGCCVSLPLFSSFRVLNGGLQCLALALLIALLDYPDLVVYEQPCLITLVLLIFFQDPPDEHIYGLLCLALILLIFFCDQDGHFNVLQCHIFIFNLQNLEVQIHGNSCSKSTDVLWNPVLAFTVA